MNAKKSIQVLEVTRNGSLRYGWSFFPVMMVMLFFVVSVSIFFMVIEWLRIVVYVHWNDRRLIISGVKIFSTNNCHLVLWPPVNNGMNSLFPWFVPFKVINFFSEYHKLWNISFACVIYFVRWMMVCKLVSKFYFIKVEVAWLWLPS